MIMAHKGKRYPVVGPRGLSPQTSGPDWYLPAAYIFTGGIEDVFGFAEWAEGELWLPFYDIGASPRRVRYRSDPTLVVGGEIIVLVSIEPLHGVSQARVTLLIEHIPGVPSPPHYFGAYQFEPQPFTVDLPQRQGPLTWPAGPPDSLRFYLATFELHPLVYV
jgi:hypothetical protein